MMNIVLSALNAKFIHSSLAIHSIYGYCSDFKKYLNIMEFTINNDDDFILRNIVESKPDVLCFSCYIWNFEMIMDIIRSVKKIIPHCVIVLGGPEVSYGATDFLKENQLVDFIVQGEGEKTFYELCEHFIYHKKLEDIKGIAYRENGVPTENYMRNFLELDSIPFIYQDSISNFDNKILYYETSRGCPFSCQYCLSSVEKGVRFLSLERVFRDLTFFLENKVKQVKLVDRTFNCNVKRTFEIWDFLIQHDNGVTNFHFEISADLLNEELLNLLKKARKGLFQFEIGVQTTNEATLNAIQRSSHLNRLFEVVEIIKSYENIHLHLDLIVGLPFEDYYSFKKSFNDVFKHYPEQLQLGFLKLLKGSGLRNYAEEYGIVAKDKAPYEVLFTDYIRYEEIVRLKLIEKLLEIYYNSGNFFYSVKYAVDFFSSPFDFFEKMYLFWLENNYFDFSHTKQKLFNLFFDFCCKFLPNNLNIIKDLLKFDMFLKDNVKNFPDWFITSHDEETKRKIRAFFAKNGKPAGRMTHIEIFDFDVVAFIDSEYTCMEMTKTAIFFDYYSFDNFGGHCYFYKVLL